MGDGRLRLRDFRVWLKKIFKTCMGLSPSFSQLSEVVGNTLIRGLRFPVQGGMPVWDVFGTVRGGNDPTHATNPWPAAGIGTCHYHGGPSAHPGRTGRARGARHLPGLRRDSAFSPFGGTHLTYMRCAQCVPRAHHGKYGSDTECIGCHWRQCAKQASGQRPFRLFWPL
jgi:hypothetical protein